MPGAARKKAPTPPSSGLRCPGPSPTMTCLRRTARALATLPRRCRPGAKPPMQPTKRGSHSRSCPRRASSRLPANCLERVPRAADRQRALRKLAAAADAPPHERGKLRAAQHASRTIEFPHEVESPAAARRCVFGVGAIVPREGKPAAVAKLEAKTGAKPPKEAGRQALRRSPLPNRWPCTRCCSAVPDADKALAVLLQRLDADTRRRLRRVPAELAQRRRVVLRSARSHLRHEGQRVSSTTRCSTTSATSSRAKGS